MVSFDVKMTILRITQNVLQINEAVSPPQKAGPVSRQPDNDTSWPVSPQPDDITAGPVHQQPNTHTSTSPAETAEVNIAMVNNDIIVMKYRILYQFFQIMVIESCTKELLGL